MGTCCSRTASVSRDFFEYTRFQIAKCKLHQKKDESETIATQTEPVIFELLKNNDGKTLQLSNVRVKRNSAKRASSTLANRSQISLCSTGENKSMLPDILFAIDRLQDICGRVGLEDQVIILTSVSYLRNHCQYVNEQPDKRVSVFRRNTLGKLSDDPEVGFWLETFNGKRQHLSGVKRFKKVALTVKTAIALAGTRFSKDEIISPTLPLLDPMEEHTKYLKANLESWEFDQFEFDTISNHHGISVIFKELLMTNHLISEFSIDCVKLKRFCFAIESGYDLHKNPYHNEIHGADVLQTVYAILKNTNIIDWFSNLELLSIFFAAMIHDVEHTGTNNVFHQSTSSTLSVLYNDKSILENHHVSIAYKLLGNPEMNPFQNMTKPQFKSMRMMVIECVLATDMAVHFDQITNLKNMLDPALISQQDLMNAIVHCADISAPGKPWNIHQRWTMLLMQEFFAQGDKEKALGMPVSPLCDRYETNIPESQVGFITYITVPAYKTMADSIDSILREKHEADFLAKTCNPFAMSTRRGSYIIQNNIKSLVRDIESDASMTPVEETAKKKKTSSKGFLESSDKMASKTLPQFSYTPIERPWDEHFLKNQSLWRHEHRNTNILEH